MQGSQTITRDPVTGYQTVPDNDNPSWPPGVPYIVGNEVCERFSYYGMRAILQVHLTALFALQLLDQQQARTSATQVVHLFMAGVYAFPMIGALAADRWIGKYNTILYLSIVYCLGNGVLALFGNSLTGMYVGLALIAIGSGGIKPCVSANVGDQFGKANNHLVRAIYQIFYFSINFGSFFATLLIPYLRSNAGYWLLAYNPTWSAGLDEAQTKQLALQLGTQVAFGLPGVLMLLATVIFWMGRHRFVHAPPRPGGQLGLLDTVCSVTLFLSLGHLFLTPELLHGPLHDYPALYWSVLVGISVVFLAVGIALFQLRQSIQPDQGFLAITLHTIRSHLGLTPAPTERHPDNRPVLEADVALSRSWFWKPAIDRYGLAATNGPVAVFKIISVFLLVTVFWALFDQHSSTWITQATQMDLWLWGQGQTSLLGIPNIKLEASQVPAINPALVMLLIPLMNVVYAFSDRLGLKTTPLRRITVGMYLTALSFVATALLQQVIDASPANSVWVGWQLVQYLLITIAEIMVSITGLEFAYTQAPRSMKSTVMGFWLLTVTLGNVLVAALAGVQKQMTAWVSSNVVPGLSQEATFFWVFAALSGVAALIFGLRALVYVPRDFTQE